ncbi:hypothetical protein [Streptomyces sp. NPDC002990]
MHNASGPVGAAALTVLAARHGVPEVSVAAGAFCLLIVGAELLSPLRAAGAAAAAGAPGRTGPRSPETGDPAGSADEMPLSR